MHFGPYTKTASRALGAKLASLNIEHRIEEDQELLAEAKDRSDPQIHVLEIDDNTYEQHKEALVRLGLGGDHPEPDFAEEYVCPDCGKVMSKQPGACPVHTTALISWSDHLAKKREAQSVRSPLGTWIASLAAAGMLAYFLYHLLTQG